MPSLDIIFHNPIYIVIAVVGVVLLWVVIARSARMPYYACEALLTKAELKFYNILKHCIPANTQLMMKVRMGDIITCDDAQWRAGWGPKISAKHIDFVIIDAKTTEILCGIELDDSTHVTNRDRVERDIFVNKAFDVAGVPLLRIPVQGFYDQGELREKLTECCT